MSAEFGREKIDKTASKSRLLYQYTHKHPKAALHKQLSRSIIYGAIVIQHNVHEPAHSTFSPLSLRMESINRCRRPIAVNENIERNIL